jgi:serine/threonine-protein kinase
MPNHSLLWDKITESAQLFPRLLRKPAVLFLWLTRSYLALAVLLAALVLAPRIIPLGADAILEWVYPRVTTKVFGVLSLRHSDPQLEERKEQARWVIWCGSGGLVLFFFWIAIPSAIDKGTRIAAAKAREADALAATSPSRSALLYRSAISYATDPEQLETLDQKIKTFDRNALQTAAPEKTVVLEPSEGVQPDFLDRYEVVQELGRGSMGVVLLARDLVLDREVAIKELPHYVAADPFLLARFRKEAKVLARLNHPGIVQVYDFAEGEGRAWIVMEYVPGEELEQTLRREGKLPLERALPLAARLAEAIQYAHSRGVLHRDLKPSNVLVATDGTPKIADFGVARLAHSDTHTRVGAVLGSPAYMSPEQAEGKEVDVRSDIYAFGVTLYKILSGRPLFEGDPAAVIAQVLTRKPQPLRELVPDLPEDVDALIMSMLEKSPANRPATMDEVLASLNRISV